MIPSIEDIADLARLRLTAELYAQGADRRDKALWRQLLTDDCVVEGPGFFLKGCEASLGAIDMLEQMFRTTAHRIHQITATINGDVATGETCSTAEHLLKDSDEILVWSIRYRDEWRREAGQWRFARRQLNVDWEETRPAKPMES